MSGFIKLIRDVITIPAEKAAAQRQQKEWEEKHKKKARLLKKKKKFIAAAEKATKKHINNSLYGVVGCIFIHQSTYKLSV